MDPLTQGLLGAAAAQAVIGKRLGHRIWIAGALGGLLPDADILIRSSADPLLAIEYHRHFTHSLAFIPAGGLIAALPWLAFRKQRPDGKLLLAASTIGFATHGLLDACTTYGTHLYWPFSDERTAWNLIATIGPLFTLFLLVGVVLAALRRSRFPAIAALCLCLAYVGVAGLQRERAVEALARIAQARGHIVARAEIFPTVGNPLVWRSIYQNDAHYHADRIRVPFRGEATWLAGSTLQPVGLDDLQPQAAADPRVRHDYQRFNYFSAGWLARAPRDASVIADARYSLATLEFEPIWGIRFVPAQTPPTEWVARDRERRIPLGELWREITGHDERYRTLPPAQLDIARRIPSQQQIAAPPASCPTHSRG